MTTSPYSEDLRLRVIKYLEKGNGYREGSRLFELSISTIGRWYRRYKEEGHCKARTRPGARRKIDLAELEYYVKSNPDITLKAVGIKFGLSAWTIQYWLKELGYSYKKKPSPTWKRNRRSGINT
jgi:transposase